MLNKAKSERLKALSFGLFTLDFKFFFKFNLNNSKYLLIKKFKTKGFRL